MPPTNRSVRINGALLRQIRLSRGWTQNDLARTSGYSARLIGKAESGASLDIETVRTLAQALSTEDEPISQQQLVVDNLFIAKAWMNALNRDGVDMVSSIEEYLSDDFQFHCPGDTSIAPFAGTWHGTEGLRKFFEIYFSIFQRVPNEEITYSVGEDLVVARYMESAYMGPQLCGPLRVNMCFQFQDGLICRIDDDYDTLGGAVIKVNANLKIEKQMNMARAFVQCYDQGGKDLATACPGFFTDDFVFCYPADSKDVPFAGEWPGVEGAQKCFDTFYSVFTRDLGTLTPEFMTSPQRIMVRFIDQVYFQGHELPPHWVNFHIQFREDQIFRIDDEFDHASAIKSLDELRAKLGV